MGIARNAHHTSPLTIFAAAGQIGHRVVPALWWSSRLTARLVHNLIGHRHTFFRTGSVIGMRTQTHSPDRFGSSKNPNWMSALIRSDMALTKDRPRPARPITNHFTQMKCRCGTRSERLRPKSKALPTSRPTAACASSSKSCTPNTDTCLFAWLNAVFVLDPSGPAWRAQVRFLYKHEMVLKVKHELEIEEGVGSGY